jgi:hypothetical protein
MNLRKLAGLAALILAVSATVLAQGPPPGGPGWGRGRGGPGGPGGPFNGLRANVKNAPYSGTEVTTTTQTLADGTTITRTNSRTISRDSQGRVRIETTHTPPGGTTANTRTTVEIFDPVAGTVSRLDPQRQTAETNTMRQPPAGANPNGRGPRGGGGGGNARPRSAAAPQIARTDLGTQMVGGVSATGTRTTRTINAGAEGNSKAISSTREVWFSAELSIPVSETDSDPRFGTTTRTITNLTRSEPDAGLFQVPAGYAVSKGHARPGRGPAQQ